MRFYSDVIEKLSKERLFTYGFDSSLRYTFSLPFSFQCILEYKNGQFFIQVFDQDGEDYLPFYVTNSQGKLVGELKEEVQNKIDAIIASCKEENPIKEEILSYVKEKYDVLPKFPFVKDTTSMTLTNDKNKWFGLIMKIKASSLGLSSDRVVEILNLKGDPEKITELFDNKKFFKAYHMNKKYWFTILLTSSISFSEIKDLIDESYQLVQ